MFVQDSTKQQQLLNSRHSAAVDSQHSGGYELSADTVTEQILGYWLLTDHFSEGTEKSQILPMLG